MQVINIKFKIDFNAHFVSLVYIFWDACLLKNERGEMLWNISYQSL